MAEELTHPGNRKRLPDRGPKTQLGGGSGYAEPGSEPYRLTDLDSELDSYFDYPDVQASVLSEAATQPAVGPYRVSPEDVARLRERMIVRSAELAVAELIADDSGSSAELPTTYIRSTTDETTGKRVVARQDADGNLEVELHPARIGKPY